jgi:NADP-dependent 3-hydroxy acid dehydrogenase YdfG
VRGRNRDAVHAFSTGGDGQQAQDTMHKAIFITGAATGIGAETARLFARNGWLVGASDLNLAGLEALQRELGADRVSIHAADVRDHAAVVGAIRAFADTTGGRLDVLFANAGIAFFGPDEQIPIERKTLIVGVNANGVVNTIDAAFPYLKATPGAHVVAMSSASAEYGVPHHAVYSATKFFVRGYTEALNIEYRAHDIQVSAIYVAYVRTGMVLDAEVKPASIDTLGVNVTPQAVAQRVWKAVHGNRSHWYVGLEARALHLATRLLGCGMMPVVRKVTKT